MKSKRGLSRKPTPKKTVEDIIGIENQELVAEKTAELKDQIETMKEQGPFAALHNDFENYLKNDNVTQADLLIDRAIEFQVKNNFQLGYFLTKMRNTEKYDQLINPLTGENYKTFEEYFESKKLKKQTIYDQMNAVQTALKLSHNKAEQAEKRFEELGSSKLALIGNFLNSKKIQKREDKDDIEKYFSKISYLKSKTYQEIKEDIAGYKPGKKIISVEAKLDRFIENHWIGNNPEILNTGKYVVLTTDKYNQLVENQ